MDKKTNEVKEIKFCPTCCTIRSGTVGGILFSAIGGALSYITSKTIYRNVISSPIEVKIASSYFGGFIYLSSFAIFLFNFHFDNHKEIMKGKTISGAISGGIAGFTTAASIYGYTVKLYDGHNALRFIRWTVPSIIVGSFLGYSLSVKIFQKIMIQRWYGDVCVPPTRQEIESYQKSLYKNEYK